MFQFGTKCGRCIKAQKSIHWKWKKVPFFKSIFIFVLRDQGWRSSQMIKVFVSQCGNIEIFSFSDFTCFYNCSSLMSCNVVQWWKKFFLHCVYVSSATKNVIIKGNTFFVRSSKYFWKIFSFDSTLFWWQWRKSVGFEFLQLINVAWKTKIANANIFIVTLDLFLVHLQKISLNGGNASVTN